MSARRLRWLTGPFVAAVLLVACTVADGLILLPEPARRDASTAPLSVCSAARWPEKPAAIGGGQDVEIVVAARLSVGSEEEIVGYDLDGVCTCADAGVPTSIPPDARPYVGESCRSTTNTETKHCDDANGRDNAFRSLATFLKDTYDFDGAFKSAFDSGNGALLVRVTGYNGLEDDDDVNVSVLSSPGIMVDGGPARQPPRGDASDRWAVRRNEVVGTPPNVNSVNLRHGWVTHHVLVVESAVDLGSAGAFKTSLSSGVLTAPIEMDDAGKPTIRTMTLAGTWATSELLSVAGRLYDPDTKVLFCHTPNYATFVKDFICAAADMNVDPKAGPDAPCNALSTGFTAIAVPASIGDKVEDTELPNNCADVPVPSCEQP